MIIVLFIICLIWAIYFWATVWTDLRREITWRVRLTNLLSAVFLAMVLWALLPLL